MIFCGVLIDFVQGPYDFFGSITCIFRFKVRCSGKQVMVLLMVCMTLTSGPKLWKLWYIPYYG